MNNHANAPMIVQYAHANIAEKIVFLKNKALCSPFFFGFITKIHWILRFLDFFREEAIFFLNKHMEF